MTRGILGLWLGGALGLAALAGAPAGAFGQSGVNPVYLDDSPSADQSLERAREFARLGNTDEAVRVLQRVLDDQGEFVVPEPGDPDLFIAARQRVHRILLADDGLMRRYRELEGPRAAAMLEAGLEADAERTRLLTDAGFDAALLLAQDDLEAARFGAAWRTLEQLEAHPSRVGERSARAGTMAGLVGAYTLEPARAARLRAVSDRWRADAGLEPDAPGPAERPRPVEQLWPFDAAPGADLGGVLSRPLAQERLGERIEEVRSLAQESQAAGLPQNARVLHAMPTVVGDTTYVNDGRTVTAFDRFTLTPRWRTAVVGPESAASRGSHARGLEDASTVTVADPFVVALTGLTIRRQTAPERVLCALDPRTGDVVWTTLLSESGDPDLADGLFRGPVVVDQDTVIVGVVRESSQLRLASVALVGFDLFTGELVWRRPIASSGFVSWVTRNDAADAPLADAGVVYRADRMGVVTAIESATGRVLWLRRAPRAFDERPGATRPWEANRPVRLDDGRLALLSPDRSRVLVIDGATGELVESIPALRLGLPHYLLGGDGVLVGVGSQQVTARPMEPAEGAEEPEVVALTRVSGAGIRGRVVVAGDRLLVPTVEGVRVVPRAFDPGRGELEGADIPLDSSGNLVATTGQLTVVDDERVHSYLSWNAAERLLRSRMDTDPGDPSPAVTFAELAYRAGRPESILGAVDHAVAAIERDPFAEVSEHSRGRLFRSLLEMVEPPQTRQAPVRLEDGLRDRLIARLLGVAREPREQVAALMAAARFLDASGRPAEAVERYQQILGSPALARSVFRLGGTAMPAATEATRRLRRLIGIEGRAVYASYDAEARRLLAEAEGSPDADTFERIARRYPVSIHAPLAWSLAADRLMGGSDERRAIYALEEGLSAAEQALDRDDPFLAELAGRLVVTLADADRPELALVRLDDLIEIGTRPTLRRGAETLDGATLRAELAARVEALRRRPRVGPDIGAMRLLDGWLPLLPAEGRREHAPADRVVMEHSETGERAVWAPAPEGGIRPLWAEAVAGDLLRVDNGSAYFASPVEGRGVSVRRVDLDTGRTIWRSAPFESLFDDGAMTAGFGPPARVNTPLEAGASMGDVYTLFGVRAVTLVERTGRAASFDLESGELLWARDLGVPRVHDADAGDGLILCVGATSTDGQGIARRPGGRPFGPGIARCFDARTGALVFEIEEPAAETRWARVTPEGRAIVGLDRAIVALDADREAVAWRSERDALSDSIGAWVFRGFGVVRNELDSLWLFDTADGGGRETELLKDDRLDSGFGRMRIVELGDKIGLATGRGLALWNERGNLLGLDSRPERATLVPPVFADDFAVTLERRGVPAGEDTMAYALNFYDLDSLKAVGATTRVELAVAPSDLLALDGVLLISTGAATAVIQAPARPGAEP